jgi:hypothetical protein
MSLAATPLVVSWGLSLLPSVGLGATPPGFVAVEGATAAPSPATEGIVRFDSLEDPSAGVDAPAAVVAGIPISRSQAYEATLLLFRGEAMRSLEQLIVQVLVRREAERVGAFVPDSIVEAELASTRRELDSQFRSEGEGRIEYDAWLRGLYGLDRETFERRLRQFLLTRTFLAFLVRYEGMQQDRTLARVLVLRDRGEAEEVRRKLLAGAEFAVLAKKHSIDPTAAEGGKLPPLAPDDPHPLADAVARLRVGETSDVEETESGGARYHRILQAYDRKLAEKGTFAERFSAVESAVRETPLAEFEIVAWIERQKERYSIDVLGASKGGEDRAERP